MTPKLKNLTDQIRDAIGKLGQGAIEVGLLLIDAKNELGQHGKWESYVKDEFNISPRHASRLMGFARRKDELTDKSATLADLSISELGRLLPPKPQRKPSPGAAMGTTNQPRRKAANKLLTDGLPSTDVEEDEADARQLWKDALARVQEIAEDDPPLARSLLGQMEADLKHARENWIPDDLQTSEAGHNHINNGVERGRDVHPKSETVASPAP
jgi:hypothetical protein